MIFSFLTLRLPKLFRPTETVQKRTIQAPRDEFPSIFKASVPWDTTSSLAPSHQTALKPAVTQHGLTTLPNTAVLCLFIISHSFSTHAKSSEFPILKRRRFLLRPVFSICFRDFSIRFRLLCSPCICSSLSPTLTSC